MLWAVACSRIPYYRPTHASQVGGDYAPAMDQRSMQVMMVEAGVTEDQINAVKDAASYGELHRLASLLG